MLADETTEFQPGQKIGWFEIKCSLGSGGMGQIYLARNGRNIALPSEARAPRTAN